MLRQKINENEKNRERLAKIKPTVPPDLYIELKILKLKLSKAKFRSSLLNQELQEINKRIQKLEETELKSKQLASQSISYYLPHLKNQEFKPSKVISNGKGSSVVAFGVGVNKLVQLPRLIILLNSLVENKGENGNLIIIVYVNINELDNKAVISKVSDQFRDELKQGLIDVIAPPINYYPDFKDFSGTFGDTRITTIENAKTNLDNVFLMMYAKKKAPFYVQLSVNLIAQPQFNDKIRNFAVKKSSSNDSWVELSFSMEGCFGKLYRSEELKLMIPFIMEFYKIKPCNWLIFGFIGTRVCHLEKNDCVNRINSNRRQFRPVLFKKSITDET